MLENFKKYNLISTIKNYTLDTNISNFKKNKLWVFLILDIFIVFPFIFTIATGNLDNVLNSYNYSSDVFFVAGMIWTFIYIIIFEQSIWQLFEYNNKRKKEKGVKK